MRPILLLLIVEIATEAVAGSEVGLGADYTYGEACGNEIWS